MDLQGKLNEYDYEFPLELIAQKPSSPRDSARLLVYNRKTKQIKFDTFKNLGKYLPKNTVLVFNETRVIPARLILHKPTGGRVEALYISHDKNLIKVLANRSLKVGDIPILDGRRNLEYKFEVVKKEGQFYFIKPNFSVSKIISVLFKYGQTPLPPYIKNSPLTEKQKRKEYQAVFAKAGESVAAPTASLHFTKQLIAKLKKQGVQIEFVSLDVSLGTFAPLKEENIKSGRLHKEIYNINEKTASNIAKAKKDGKTIIAVGTTVVRTLESYAKTKKLSGSTDLFVHPPYKFKIINGLITNFHVPKSSLLMLVASLTGRERLFKVYRSAIKKRFRLFSFGDGMLIL